MQQAVTLAMLSALGRGMPAEGELVAFLSQPDGSEQPEVPVLSFNSKGFY